MTRPAHYHVISLDDSSHQTPGYQDSAQADAARADLDAIHGSRHTTVECRSPRCELVTTSHSGGPGDFTADDLDDRPALTCQRCGGPWTPRSPSVWLCADCYFPTV